MKLLDDCTAESLTGGNRRMSAARHSFNFSLSVNNVITVIPQVATGVAITALGGESSAILSNFAFIDINLG